MSYINKSPLDIQLDLDKLPHKIAEASDKCREAMIKHEEAKLITKREWAKAYILHSSEDKITVKEIEARILNEKDYQKAQNNEIIACGEYEACKIALERVQNEYISTRKIVNLKELEYQISGAHD